MQPSLLGTLQNQRRRRQRLGQRRQIKQRIYIGLTKCLQRQTLPAAYQAINGVCEQAVREARLQ